MKITELNTLVLSCSGSKIYMFIGVLNFLKEVDLLKNINTFIGSSGGSIISFLLSLNYSIESIKDLITGINSQLFTNIDADSFINFFDNYGLNDLSEAERILRIILNAKINQTRLTFKELYNLTNNKLVICATNLNKYKTVYFSFETHPNLDIVDAVLMSCCIPFLFSPKKFDSEYYVDGGIICHYPIEYVNKNELDTTLGILVISDYYLCDESVNTNTSINNNNQLVCKKQIDINTIEDYIFTVLCCPMFKINQDKYLEYKENTILLINNKNGLDLSSTYDEQTKLINQGYIITKQFINEKLKVEKVKELKLKEETLKVETFKLEDVKLKLKEDSLKLKEEKVKERKLQRRNSY